MQGQKGFALIIILLLVLVLGGVVVYKLSTQAVPKATPSPTASPMSEEAKILSDLQKKGLSCETEGEIPGGCSVTTVTGNYAKGLMPGAYWIAKKVNGTWTLAVAGNGIQSCSEIDKFEVPREMYGNCIDASGELRN